MIDQLKLFRGEGYKINDKILIRQPTLEEIVDFGEQRYFGLVRTICSTPADRKVEIWDKLHVFWEKIDEYDLFISLFQTLQKSEVSILFGDMDFTTFKLGTQTGLPDLVLKNKDQVVIDRAIHKLMTDYYVIYHDIEELKQIARDIVKKFESFGIRVNKKKCKIIPLTKPFRFCKARFTLTETGAIKINGSRDGVKRARRKLKMFHREYLAGRKTLFEIDQYMECQTAYYRHFDDHGRLLRLRRLHYAMFNRYREQEQLKKSA